MLMELQPDTIHQGELDLEGDHANERSQLMGTLDRLNDRYGRGTLKIASEGMAGDQRAWAMRQQLRTPHYTTRWADAPVAKA